jgi:hypothetical protein
MHDACWVVLCCVDRCTVRLQLLGLSEIGGDLDGGLLVTDESQAFNGGFIWGAGGAVQWRDDSVGSAATVVLEHWPKSTQV